MMTAMTRLLKQGSGLRLRAQNQTGDVNEAYFLVHTVMVRALKSGGGCEHDVEAALGVALNARFKRSPLPSLRAAI
jgi:hypothetical protein